MLVPLRAFLGFTFCFAGLQKLANPGFITASNPSSIQSQLAGASLRSPIHALISPLMHVAVPLGLLIAFSELAIGIGTLLGLWQRVAAAGGIALSFMLFLTVSFHSSPYYTGADIVFAFAWTPLLVAGAGPRLSADAAIAASAGANPRRASRPAPRGQASRNQQPRPEVTRKGVITVFAALGGLALGVLVAGIGRLANGNPSSGAGNSLPPVQGSGGSGAATPGARRSSGQLIGPAADVPVGGAASFTDPRTGNPSIVLRPDARTFLAYDAVCPHAGCTVGYQQSARLLVCPCHGSEFSPSTGAVQTGPAPTGLARISISEAGGQLYAD